MSGEAVPSRGVFVIGCPRSGTSALAWALAQHPSLWTSAESDFLWHLFGKNQIWNAYRAAFERPDPGWLAKNNVGFAEFCRQIGAGIDSLFLSRSGGRRWVDATPSYTLIAELLLTMFPNARFLHIVRDGRAVVSSMMSSGFDVHWADDFEAACQTWSHFALGGHRFATAHPDRVLEIRNEALIEAPADQLQTVFEFLGEGVSARAIDFIRTKRVNSSYGNLKPEDIRRAKNPRELPERPWEKWGREGRDCFQGIAGEAMKTLGYDGD